MCDFEPGDEVVCVDDAPCQPWETKVVAGLPATGIVKGQVYTVEGVGLWPGDLKTPVLFLRETANRDLYGVDYGFLPRRFRKVQRRDLTAWLATENTIEAPVRPRVPA